MKRRRYLALSALTLAGCTSSSDSAGDGPDTDDQDENETTAIPEPDPIQLSGSGQTVTDEFDIAGGFTIFELAHSGSSNFIVELHRGGQGRVEMLANEIGGWRGTIPYGLAAGEYALDTEADGDWSATITQPRPSTDDVQSLPVEMGDNYPNYIGPIEYTGSTRIEAAYEGDSNFVVEVLNINGERVELAFNEVGAFKGTTLFSGEGAGWIRVQATGPWGVVASEQ